MDEGVGGITYGGALNIPQASNEQTFAAVSNDAAVATAVNVAACAEVGDLIKNSVHAILSL